MTLKQAPTTQRPYSVLVSRALKIVGIVVTLAALVDILILPIPYQLGDRQWQINFAAQMVDRGVVPLVGIALILTGFWVDSVAGGLTERKRLWQDPRFYACLLSSLLGLMFVLLFPLHLNNVRIGNTEVQGQLEQQATQAQTDINTRLQAEVQSQRQQIQQLLGATDEQLQQLVTAGQLSQEQANRIKEFKANPASLDTFLKEREGQLREQLQSQVGVRKEEQAAAIRNEALKSGLRVGLSSLLLAIGFSAVGWLGLRNLASDR
ncbi:hormogonium polysaccharide biosynthesis protein HpsJ [Leptolyngbya ohadii]|uniref:hormogonium polysaccharide biosynthesis protein HpsJ n=1 Tax=Leptolyngbya ohadii TaxID=1962290 RepID=UPI000B59A0C0|nr:HpsJ family protein [Leptolyngbya ohadii]